jgi:[amino group carrier protein]-L-2-aminoadipate/L-glutamate 6-kinase
MILVKVGGGADINLEGIARDLSELERPAVIVHGANACRDELAERLRAPTRRVTSESGIESTLTDGDALAVLMMAYAGLANKRFVSLCQRHGVNAVGLTGLDGGLVRGRRNRGIRVVEDGRRRLLHDLSGKPVAINVELLRLLLDSGYTPVLTVPILDERGEAINTENDDVVALLHETLSGEPVEPIDEVVQLIEAPGLLGDSGHPESLLTRLGLEELRERESRASGRYRRKLMALLRMMEAGCPRIVVADGRRAHPLRSALDAEGTVIQCETLPV